MHANWPDGSKVHAVVVSYPPQHQAFEILALGK